jgi:hypothetical protein
MNEKKIDSNGDPHIDGDAHTKGGDSDGDKNVVRGTHGIAIGGNVSGSTIVHGDHNVIGSQVSIESPYRQQIYATIEGRPQTSPKEQADIEAQVKELEQEDAKGELADAHFIEERLRNLRQMAPDIFEVVVATIANPVAGFGLIAKKVVEKIQAEAT